MFPSSKFQITPFALALLTAVLAFSGCRPDEEPTTDWDTELHAALTQASGGIGPEYYLLPGSNELAKIPQDPANPLTEEKIQLGKFLYHETGIGLSPKLSIGKQTYSCASCHLAVAGFQAGRVQGIGEGGLACGAKGEGRFADPAYPIDSLDVQPIRSPSVLNTAYQELMLWNGQFGATGDNVGTENRWFAGEPPETNFLGYEGLETQAIAGLEVHRMVLDTVFLDSTGYKPLFDAAFPQIPVPDRYDQERAGLAIAAYERTVLANQAPFQQWLRGQRDALSEEEKQGAVLFFERARCYRCHNGPSLANMNFYALGMHDLIGPGIYGSTPTHMAHLGRGGFTGNPNDNYKFKVPQLYNLKDSPHYGHGGNFKTVREVIEYKNIAEAQNPDVPRNQLADDFDPLLLSPEDISAITAFIEKSLYDPNLMRYQPASIPSGLCFPLADPQSQIDLGCQ